MSNAESTHPETARGRLNGPQKNTASPVPVLWLSKGLGRGGAEQLLSLSLSHVDRARFDVEIAYVLPWKDALVEGIRSQGITVHCLGSPGPRAAWPVRLRRLLTDRGYRVVHTHSPVPAAAARLLLPRDATAVHTEHNEWSRYRRATRVANTATYGRNAAVMAVSGSVADSVRSPRWAPWVRLPPMEVLHHGIDQGRVRRGKDARARARRTLGLDDEHEVIGTVGNFTPKKDQRTLLRAVQILAASHPGIRLVLVGTGTLERALRDQASEPGLAGRVHFAGSRDDVQELLPAFDVFALSSIHEGLPIALLEAMAAGLPCVATRVGGMPELLLGGHAGLLVQPSDPHGLADAIDRILSDPGLATDLGTAAVEAAGGFSIERAVKRMEAVYDEVLGLR